MNQESKWQKCAKKQEEEYSRGIVTNGMAQKECIWWTWSRQHWENDEKLCMLGQVI